MPRTLRRVLHMGASTIRCYLVNGLRIRHHANGYCFPDHKIIAIDPAQPPGGVNRTDLHECLHMALAETGYDVALFGDGDGADDAEEAFVCAMETMLYQAGYREPSE